MNFPPPATPDRQTTPNDDDALLAIVHDPTASADEVASAKELLITAHMPLVEHIARRYRDRGEPFDDLVQVGAIGLLKAIERFDTERGTALSTYATPTIVGEIKRHFRDRGWNIRIPRRLQELGMRIRSARADLTQSLGRTPTVAEIAAALGVDIEEVLEAMESAHAYAPVSLEVPTTDDGRPLDESLGSSDVGIALVVNRETLRPALATLAPRERKALVMRYFGHRTQSEDSWATAPSHRRPDPGLAGRDRARRSSVRHADRYRLAPRAGGLRWSVTGQNLASTS